MKYAICVGLLVAICLAGCGGREGKLVGNWQGSVKLSDEDRQNPMAGMAQSMMGSSRLELRPDKTFSAQIMMMPIEGTWTLEGATVHLKPTSMAGMDAGPNSNDMKLAVSSDNKTLTIEDSGNSGPAFVFTKAQG